MPERTPLEPRADHLTPRPDVIWQQCVEDARIRGRELSRAEDELDVGRQLPPGFVASVVANATAPGTWRRPLTSHATAAALLLAAVGSLAWVDAVAVWPTQTASNLLLTFEDALADAGRARAMATRVVDILEDHVLAGVGTMRQVAKDPRSPLALSAQQGLAQLRRSYLEGTMLEPATVDGPSFVQTIEVLRDRHRGTAERQLAFDRLLRLTCQGILALDVVDACSTRVQRAKSRLLEKLSAASPR